MVSILARKACLCVALCMLTDMINAETSDPGSSNTPVPPVAVSGSPSASSTLKSEMRYRSWFDQHGLTGNLALTNDWSENFHGGAEQGTAERYLFKTALTIDTDKSFGWPGGTALVSLQHHLGDDGGHQVGDAQGFSNIDAPQRTHLYELWYQQVLFGRKLRVKAGKVDANSEFAVVENASDFLNSSMGYSPTIMTLPTYPEPRPSMNVFLQPSEHYSVAGGFYQVAGTGGLWLGEAGKRWALGTRELPGRTSLGFWRLNGTVADFDSGEQAGTAGFYLVSEQTLWRPRQPEPTREEAVSAFLQYGSADGDVSSFRRHLGGGLVWQNLFHRRPKDAVGIGATQVLFSELPEAGFEYRNELAVETYYRLQVVRGVVLVPDLQYIRHPGGLRCQRDAVVLTPRVVLSF